MTVKGVKYFCYAVQYVGGNYHVAKSKSYVVEEIEQQQVLRGLPDLGLHGSATFPLFSMSVLKATNCN